MDLIAEDRSEHEETSALKDVQKRRARLKFGPEPSKRSHFYS